MIFKVCTRIVISMLLLGCLTGCWDMKTIQDTNYMTAIGFDYKDGKYIVYGQMISFGSVSKQEGGSSGQVPLIWVGKEEGKTVSEAFNELYKTSQDRVFWGHVGAFLFTKAALMQGLDIFIDGSIRYSETRFTQWVYCTDESIDRVFSVIPFFNGSPMSSILMQPVDNYRQRSYITPHRLYWMISRLLEPGYTVMLPTLSINKEVWRKNEKPDAKLYIDGAYAVNKDRRLEWFSEDTYTGARWTNDYTKRASMTVLKDGKAVQSVSINAPKSETKLRMDGGHPVFDIEITAPTAVSEIFEEMDETELRMQVGKQIREEIERTFKLAKDRETDIYSLGYLLYKQDFKTWAKLTANGAKPLSDYNLGTVDVKVNILHSGMLKMKAYEDQY